VWTEGVTSRAEEGPCMATPFVHVELQTQDPAKARGKTEVPGFGWFSMIQDPTGAVLGLWQPRAKA
ncbi:MAG: VOC family protein, partial [Candidatus Rokuibacteriota bacterium]